MDQRDEAEVQKLLHFAEIHVYTGAWWVLGLGSCSRAGFCVLEPRCNVHILVHSAYREPGWKWRTWMWTSQQGSRTQNQFHSTESLHSPDLTEGFWTCLGYAMVHSQKVLQVGPLPRTRELIIIQKNFKEPSKYLVFYDYRKKIFYISAIRVEFVLLGEHLQVLCGIYKQNPVRRLYTCTQLKNP